MQKIPNVGDDVYVPTIADENNTYIVGGLAKVTEVIEGQLLFAGLNVNFRWKDGLDSMQENLKNQFGNQRAYSTGIIPPCPLK